METVVIVIIFVEMKGTLSLSLSTSTITAINDFCKERNISVSSYMQMLADIDINSGFNGINNGNNGEELVLSYDNEVLTANEARLLMRNNPCRKFLYIEDIGETE